MLREQSGGLRREIDLVKWEKKRKTRRHDKKKSHLCFCFPLPFPFSAFVLRLLESSMLNAEVKEGEILPPTIHRLMKGYNKYLRPFFDSKETADTRSQGKSF